jgi:transcription initiation factor TFIIIB Brf1 subunit/transcription initiation factor TFIIB|tara:strand:- start:6 stop:140 length:135 start_codon:yes stop_codon:yes gene_type:complete
MDITSVTECPECASSNVIHVEDKEQVVCQDCGNIYEPTVDEVKK